jgi:hypothetical protein
MFGEDFLRIWVFLDLPGARQTCSVKSEIEATDACEK